MRARQVREQHQRRRDQKIYCLDAAEVECIGKSKAHRPYEFGVKVSVATRVDRNCLAHRLGDVNNAVLAVRRLPLLRAAFLAKALLPVVLYSTSWPYWTARFIVPVLAKSSFFTFDDLMSLDPK